MQRGWWSERGARQPEHGVSLNLDLSAFDRFIIEVTSLAGASSLEFQVRNGLAVNFAKTFPTVTAGILEIPFSEIGAGFDATDVRGIRGTRYPRSRGGRESSDSRL